ncbi:MAG: glutathione S-transferase family protein [Steroidobacteraceae bacterium]|nr:glutathione S-transferase family protein [Pseudomonadota bacterium]
MNDDEYTLWGSPHSYYTGKIRSYLIKKGVPYREQFAFHPDFQARILPAIRMLVVPVLETPDGRIVQDTTDMIEELESASPTPSMIPQSPVQRAVAWLLGAFGSEGLLAPGMHYRWSYRAEQENFLCAEFGRLLHQGPDRAARDATARQTMQYFNGFLPFLGITATTIPTIETAYGELLDTLDEHFLHYPYLLGGRPSIADFGLMAPMFAHLARDPVPATLMKNRAPNVYRWTERMNLAQIADGEFPDCPATYVSDDVIPATLEPVLRLVFQDWGAQLLADASMYETWLESDPTRPAGTMVSASGERKIHTTLGPLQYQWRDCVMQRASSPHGLWHFDKAAVLARALTGDAKTRFDALVRRAGGEQVMSIPLSRPMRRENYVLVLA